MRDNSSSSLGECSVISTYVDVLFGDQGMTLEDIRSLSSPKMAMEIYMDTLDLFMWARPCEPPGHMREKHSRRCGSGLTPLEHGCGETEEA